MTIIDGQAVLATANIYEKDLNQEEKAKSKAKAEAKAKAKAFALSAAGLVAAVQTRQTAKSARKEELQKIARMTGMTGAKIPTTCKGLKAYRKKLEKSRAEADRTRADAMTFQPIDLLSLRK